MQRGKKQALEGCGRDRDVTHCLDLSGISFPLMALSLGLKRLSGKKNKTGAHARKRAKHRAWQWITRAFLGIWRHWKPPVSRKIQSQIMLQSPERADEIILNKNMKLASYGTDGGVGGAFTKCNVVTFHSEYLESFSFWGEKNLKSWHLFFLTILNWS